MIVDESNNETFEKVKKITSTDYEIRWFNAEHIEGYIDVEGLLCMIEDLLCEIDYQKEKYQELEESINYVDDRESYIPEIHGKGISY